MYQKVQGIKGQLTYSRISLFNIMILSYLYDLTGIGTEEFVKDSIGCMLFCGFRLED
ncbi:MAG: transposase [Flavobacteriales bacterium Tduv]